eukprot:770459-Rhodomonas_salina.1
MAHPTAIRTVLAWGVKNGYFIHQTDIKLAFISSELQEVVYMSPPPGCEEPNGFVWWLHSGQYSLRQSSAAFAKTLLRRLYEFRFKAASADECVLVYREPMEGANDGS